MEGKAWLQDQETCLSHCTCSHQSPSKQEVELGSCAPPLLHAEISAGLFLHGSCAGNGGCCEFVRAKPCRAMKEELVRMQNPVSF